ncbi:hypothetical protein [Segetibacter aerophilus]|uniref:DUF937 domain-containing protein n=1 Tax=Segetibacter aerophilus TaxID=670293 RepID=A0A512BIY9_9BACT|nr:hypothetical protein [Segetibacter aerophilus]GEO11942.1 hypothetical protein SAE01_44380 [Segetibacter aerophilus]
MLENLQNLIREHAGDAIINNPAIPNERNEEAVADASSSIISGLKTAVANGNTEEVQSLFKNGPAAASASPVAQNIQTGFAQNLMQKFGLDSGKAGGIAASLIPIVLQKFVHKTNDPNDKSFDLSSVLGSLTGGGGLGSIMNGLGGGEKDGGGIMGKIGGMFK